MKPGSISGVRAFVLFSVFVAMLLPATGLALTPNEIMIVANRRVAEGVDLARYYGKKRGIPDENLLVLDLPTGETCRRDDYERRIARPIRERLSAIQPSGRPRRRHRPTDDRRCGPGGSGGRIVRGCLFRCPLVYARRFTPRRLPGV